jgi:hypothetical protein
LRQGGVKAEGQEGHENVGFHAILVAVEVRAQGKVALEIFESFLNLIIVGGSRVE